jgi:hypothetical protein
MKSYLTDFLTDVSTVSPRAVRETPAGMMFWAGSCSDPKARCGGCKHYGRGDEPARKGRFDGCSLYRKHMGVGYKLDKNTLACKYFESKQP